MILLLGWQVHRERTAREALENRPLALENHRLRDRNAGLDSSVRQYIRAADVWARRAALAEGKLDQCEAITY